MATFDVDDVGAADGGDAALDGAVGVETAEQRGLACTATSDKVHEITLFNVEVHVLEQRTVLVVDADVLEVYNGMFSSVVVVVFHVLLLTLI